MLTFEQQALHLQKVSRTFALTIPLLPMPLADWVGNAYLLCRIVDTIEDDAHLTTASKKQHIEVYLAALQGLTDGVAWSHDLHSALSELTPHGERLLIADIPAVLARLASFPAPVQAILIRGVSIMSKGMALQQECVVIAQRADLDRYCYSVAGVVGELLTELFAFYSPAIATEKVTLAPLAVSFGEGLQLTNILKDVWEDASRGVCWLPSPTQSGGDFSACSLELQQQILDEHLALAHGHLRDALRFTQLLPRQEQGLRQFCLWAIGMALLTLQKIHATPQFRQSSQVKISRRQVKSIILGCQLLGQFDGPLRLYFRWLARGLPLMQRDPLEIYQSVSAWNDIPL